MFAFQKTSDLSYFVQGGELYVAFSFSKGSLATFARLAISRLTIRHDTQQNDTQKNVNQQIDNLSTN